MKCWQVLDPDGRVVGVNLWDGFDLRFLADGYRVRCSDAHLAIDELMSEVRKPQPGESAPEAAPVDPTHAPSTSEPPPEDVATPALDDVFNVYVNNHLVGTLHKTVEERIKAAYRRDLAAATEELRAENELLREEATSWRVMWSDKHDEYAQLQEELRLADQKLSQLGDLARPHARQGENLIDAAFRLLKENEGLRVRLADTEKVLGRFRQEAQCTQQAQADLCVYLNEKQFPEHYPTSWTDGVPNIALAVLKRLEKENDDLRRQLSDCQGRNREASDALVAKGQEINKLKAELERRITCHHLDGTPEGTEVCYLHDGRIYIMGSPSESDDHNCDEMGCGSVGSHVMRIISLSEVSDLRRQLREHAGECAACGEGVNRHSFMGLGREALCEECAHRPPDDVRAAIDARRAGK